MDVIKLRLSRPQLNKLRLGHRVQLKNRDIANGSGLDVSLSLKKLAKLLKAKKAGKGMRFDMTKEEWESNAGGEGFKDFLKKAVKASVKGAKKAGKFYTKELKPIVGPYIKEGVKQGKELFIKSLEASNPELIPVLETADEIFGDAIVEKLGDVSGAYGFMRSQPLSGSSQLMRFQPIYIPEPGLYQVSIPKAKGGSFKPAGAGFR